MWLCPPSDALRPKPLDGLQFTLVLEFYTEIIETSFCKIILIRKGGNTTLSFQFSRKFLDIVMTCNEESSRFPVLHTTLFPYTNRSSRASALNLSHVVVLKPVSTVRPLIPIVHLEVFLVNKANLVHKFSCYVYFFSLHVSGDCVPVIRENNCIYATLDTCYSVYMTLWYARQSSIHGTCYSVVLVIQYG